MINGCANDRFSGNRRDNVDNGIAKGVVDSGIKRAVNKPGVRKLALGLREALRLTLENTGSLAPEIVSLLDSVDRVASADVHAQVDSPSQDVSRKDGYALRSADIAAARTGRPVGLRVLGTMVAGGENSLRVMPGTTVKVFTGARIPEGADVVVPEEFVGLEDGEALFDAFWTPGTNILRRGSDVAVSRAIVNKGQQISPVMTGVLAAAGCTAIPVVRIPKVGIIGIGDELVEPGGTLTGGKVYASNIITLAGLCRKNNIDSRITTVSDEPGPLHESLDSFMGEMDAVVTSGGAWTGDRDIVARVLEDLGWKKIFHRIRIGPGKAVGFGILRGKPVFILPGGPPSNLMGFLQIALPGLLSLAGRAEPCLPEIKACLAGNLNGGNREWTDFFFGTLDNNDQGLPAFRPMQKRSRLGSIAGAMAVGAIPEGEEILPEGAEIMVQLIR